MTHALGAEMKSCIDNCLKCYSVCVEMAMNHCLEMGGKHVAPRHFRLMAACAEVCRTAAHLMLTSSDHHKVMCAICSKVCADCANDCAELGDMDDCVQACRKCADSCRKMAG